MRHRIAALVLLASFLSAPLSAYAQCADWLLGPFDNGSASNGANGTIQCTAYWDPDADGPLPTRLVVGGNFTSIGGVAAQHVAWRDPVTGQWNAFGAGVGIYVYAIAVYNNQVVVGGGGDSDPGNTDDNILRWDGSVWTTFYGGTSTGSCYALAVYNGQLYAGGSFVIYPAVLNPASYVARWNDGAGRWESVSSGTNGNVRALYPWGGYLYAGGEFSVAGGVTAHFIARWDGTWHALPSEPLGVVMDLAPGLNGELLATGAWLNGNNVAAPGVGGWNGSAWVVRPTTTSNGLWASVAAYNGSIYAAGYFTTVNGSTFSHIARWNGSAWENVGNGTNAPITDLIPIHNELLAVGSFTTAGGVVANSIGRWNGYEWGNYGGGTTAGVTAMTTYNGRVVAGGNFHQFAGTGPSAHFIAGWNATSGLTSFGSGMDNPVLALKSYTTGTFVNQAFELVAGGTFTVAGGVACNHIARWIERSTIITTPAWAPMGAGVNGPVYAVERFNSATYAGGSFSLSGATSVPNIARWNNTSGVWENIGTMNGPVFALKTFNGQLYAGGSFTTAGGVSTGGLARWNGSSWSACGGFFGGTVLALEIYNNQLAIGGLFPGINSSPNLAQYDGTSYSTFGTGGTNDYVRTLKANGNRLYVGGDFTVAGGWTTGFIAYWDGAWHPLPGALSNKPLAMTTFNNELHAGGYFTTVDAGTLLSPSWARYTETGVPWFAKQPGSQSVAPGATLTLDAVPVAGYPGFTIQWYKNGVPLADGPTGHGSTVSGAHTTQLTITNTDSHTDWGQYYAIVANGCGSVQSATATVSFEGYLDVPDAALTTAFLGMGPNPSRGATQLAYSLARDGRVRVRVHDVAGRLVWGRDLGTVGAGRHRVDWDARDDGGQRVRAGLYFVSLDVDGTRLGARRLVVTQ